MRVQVQTNKIPYFLYSTRDDKCEYDTEEKKFYYNNTEVTSKKTSFLYVFFLKYAMPLALLLNFFNLDLLEEANIIATIATLSLMALTIYVLKKKREMFIFVIIMYVAISIFVMNYFSNNILEINRAIELSFYIFAFIAIIYDIYMVKNYYDYFYLKEVSQTIEYQHGTPYIKLFRKKRYININKPKLSLNLFGIFAKKLRTVR